MQEDGLTPAERLSIAFDLFEFGEDLMRQNLRRQHPSATPARIESLLLEWLQNRPFAQPDDPVLRPIEKFG